MIFLPIARRWMAPVPMELLVGSELRRLMTDCERVRLVERLGVQLAAALGDRLLLLHDDRMLLCEGVLADARNLP